MMKCYVPTLTTDLVTILFLNIGEVIARELGVIDFVTVSFCSSREDRKAKADPVQKAARWWGCVISPCQGQGRGEELWPPHATRRLLSLGATHAFAWERHRFPSWWVILWRSRHAKGISTAAGKPEGRTQPTGERVAPVLPTTLHLRAGWELPQPLATKVGLFSSMQ